MIPGSSPTTTEATHLPAYDGRLHTQQLWLGANLQSVIHQPINEARISLLIVNVTYLEKVQFPKVLLSHGLVGLFYPIHQLSQGTSEIEKFLSTTFSTPPRRKCKLLDCRTKCRRDPLDDSA
jgi:hypothetical protein